MLISCCSRATRGCSVPCCAQTSATAGKSRKLMRWTAAAEKRGLSGDGDSTSTVAKPFINKMIKNDQNATVGFGGGFWWGLLWETQENLLLLGKARYICLAGCESKGQTMGRQFPYCGLQRVHLLAFWYIRIFTYIYIYTYVFFFPALNIAREFLAGGFNLLVK